MGLRRWLRRVMRPAEPPLEYEPAVVDKCAAWVEWEQWDMAVLLASRGIGPSPCRHWHVADGYERFGYTHQEYWTRHWWERHRMSPPHPAATRGTL